MNLLRHTILASLVALALSACTQDAPTPPAAPAEPAAPAAPVAESAPAAADPVAPAADAPVASADSIGVAACDDYLTKYEACIADKVPAEARDALKSGLDQTRGAWKTAIAGGTKPEDLGSACAQMHEASRASMQAYGCTDF